MPRSKIYSTKQEKLRAERAKSARHYQKNRELILARRKERRKQKHVSEECEKREKRIAKKNSLKVERQGRRAVQLLEAKGERNETCPVWRMRNVENALNTETKDCPSSYLDNVCQELLAWYISEDRTSKNPLDYPRLVFHSFLHAVDRIGALILEDIGGGELTEEWRASQRMRKRLVVIIDCLDALAMGVMSGDLVEEHEKRCLNHQKEVWRRCMDGIDDLDD
ncbi:hypothetical protein VNI00_016898 [Paramarasmius palmivorus]|uniref:Uncharacterized protein n=1 Tax=Paramarasmius palmivorus TaxID=297713 RepID=A0AAW0BA98_9AGAR